MSKRALGIALTTLTRLFVAAAVVIVIIYWIGRI